MNDFVIMFIFFFYFAIVDGDGNRDRESQSYPHDDFEEVVNDRSSFIDDEEEAGMNSALEQSLLEVMTSRAANASVVEVDILGK